VLRDRLRELTGVDVGELSGAVVEGELPLTDAVVTRLAARYIPSSAPVSDLRIEALENNQLNIQLAVRGSRMLPQVKIAAVIERQPEPESPVLGLRWSLPALGPLAMLAAPALSFFKALPPGISVDGDRIAVDIAQLLRSRGFEEVLPYLRRVRVTTRHGAIVVGFAVRVP
jgi:hypothetical protein